MNTDPRTDLQNLSTQVALEAYARLTQAQAHLSQTDPAAFRLAYEASARQVLAEQKAERTSAA